MKTKSGFTLAEVLVTLAIIGVVAALTIPTLIGNSQERQARTSVKKAMSLLNQALAMSIANDGTGANAVADTPLALKNLFAAQLKVLKHDDANAAITTADGMIYSFSKTAACAEVANNNPAGAACLIEVDINGDAGNETPGRKTSYTDLYYFLVYDSSVVPAKANGWNPNIATFRDTLEGAGTTLIGDVAHDAIIK